MQRRKFLTLAATASAAIGVTSMSGLAASANTPTVRQRRIGTPDGRTLQVIDIGDTSAMPIVVMHGSPSARLEALWYSASAAAIGARLIAFDRPGFGGSTPKPGRTVGDAAADVRTVTMGLGLSSFSVLGCSSGGPHALATAGVPGVHRIATVGPLAPYPAPAGADYFAGMAASSAGELMLAIAGRAELEPQLAPVAAAIAADPAGMVDAMAADLPPEDLAVLDRPGVREMLPPVLAEGVRQGAAGWVDDDLAMVAPWGFSLADISVPVALWHGAHDQICPPSHSMWLHDAIRGSELHIESWAGHLLALAKPQPILRWLMAP